MVQHPPPPAGPPNEPEVFQLFLTGKLFSPLTLAVECNLARAVELDPCKTDEGKELTAAEKTECCKGIFTNKILLPDSNGDYPTDTSQSGRVEAGVDDLWAGSGCFCIPDIMNDNLPFFNAVLDIAKTCGGSYDITTIPCSSSITTSCTSGFTTDCSGVTVGGSDGNDVTNGFVGKSQAQMKADVAARPASNVPPAPDPAPAATKGAKKIQVDIRLKDATGFLGDSTAAKAKRTELETNLAKALCNCVSPTFKVKLVAVSKGSTIVTAEVQPAEGSSEITTAQVDTINDQMEQDGGLGKSASMTAYGNVTATLPAPAPPGQAPAPVRDAKKIALPKGLNTPPAKLPAAVTGIPRTGIDGSSYEGGFEIDNSKYLESLAGQMLPGIVMAVLLFVIMILMLLVYLVSTLCGLTFCKCCNGAYKPRRFSKKDLKINKVVCLVFCAITAAGAFTVFAETPPLLENTKDLTGAMAGTISELSANVTAIADAMEAAAEDPTLNIGDIASTTTTMKDAMASVDKTVQDAQDQIEEYVDMSGLYVTIAAGIMFGITFIVFALGFVGFWRLLIFFTIILSIMMIIGWIVWGLLSLLTVFVDDLCWAMNDYLRDRYNSDLSDFIPCMDPKVAVSTMNVGRDQVASGIAAVNDQLEEYAGGENGNPYLKYLCYNYAKVPLKDLCNKKTIYHDQAYSTFVCQAEDQKKLTEKADMTSYDSTVQDLIMFPDAFCPYPTNFYSVALGNFSKPASAGGLGQLRCPFKGYSDDAMTQAIEFSMGQCYTVKQLPSDVFDAKAATAAKAQLVLDVMPKIESLLQCELVGTAFSRMVGPCDGMATALTSLYAGFLLVAMGYFLLWASTLVLISRLQYYRSYCVDADKY